MKTLLAVLVWMLTLSSWTSRASDPVILATLNCYWFFSEDERSASADPPKTEREYDLKAGHLIGLLPPEPPLFLGLEEIGNGKDVTKLVHSANARFKRTYVPLFVQGRDTATKQDVGAIFDTSRGWGVVGQASRVSELERELSKHLVVRITNATARLDICVVHLRVPRDAAGIEKQRDQNRALLRWSMRHLAQDPKANVVILGDFNEGEPVGSPTQALSVLFQSRPPMHDPFETLKIKVATHAGGKAFDRILLSDGLMKGLAGLKFDSVSIQRHSWGRGEERRLYTDHFPVSVRLVGPL